VSPKTTIKVRVTVAWWLSPYLTALVFLCRLHGTAPNEEKLRRVIAKAIRVRKT
jgi:hypothetical protein